MMNKDELREKAKKILLETNIDNSHQFGDNLKELLEELSIHQIELETQNEELRRVQEELESARNSYVDLYENAPIGYLLIDNDYSIINANTTVCNMLGIDKDLILGTSVEKMISPAYQITFYHFVRLLKKTGNAAQIDVKMRSKRREIFVRIDAIYLANQRHLRFALSDIQLQKRLETQLRNETEKLQKSELRFRQFVEHSSDLFFSMSLDTHQLEYVSPKCEDLLFYTPIEFYRMDETDLKSLLLPSYRNGFVKLLKAMELGLYEMKSFSSDLKIRAKKGNVKWFKISCSLLKPKEEGIGLGKMIGSLKDITSEKQYENDLIVAKEKAEENDTLKSAFLANMSHEIRTPLNAIIGFSSLLVNTKEKTKKTEYISIINENSDLLLKLITDILDISKIESQAIVLNEAVFDVYKMCEDIVKTYSLKEHVGKECIKIFLEDGLTKAFILNDKIRVGQVITNFINNAYKFTEEGSITLGYTILKSNEIEFYVTDTGIGIEKGKESQIFDRFIKLDSFSQGVGLGLSICKKLVTQMKGRIGVRANKDKGSCFWFAIPYNPDIDILEDLSTGYEKKKFDNDKRPTILIAEDIDSNYLLVYLILKKDYNVLHARNGEMAIEMYEKNHPDMIIMDVKMPRIDGLEAARRIRKVDKKIPIVITTAYAHDINSDDLDDILNRGCLYMAKPMTETKLKDMVKTVLEC